MASRSMAKGKRRTVAEAASALTQAALSGTLVTAHDPNAAPPAIPVRRRKPPAAAAPAEPVPQLLPPSPQPITSTIRRPSVGTGSEDATDRLIALLDAAISDEEPAPAGLGAGEAIAAGILAGVDPQGFERIAPLLERRRQEPIEQFRREQERKARAIGATEIVRGLEIEREAKQREMQERFDAVGAHLSTAEANITGWSSIAADLQQSDNPADKIRGEAILEKTLLYDQFIDQVLAGGADAATPQAAEMLTRKMQEITGLVSGARESQIAGIEAGQAAEAEFARDIALENYKQAGRLALIAAKPRGNQRLPAQTLVTVGKYAGPLAGITTLLNMVDPNSFDKLPGGPFATLGTGFPLTGKQSDFRARWQKLISELRLRLQGASQTMAEKINTPGILPDWDAPDYIKISALDALRDSVLDEADGILVSLSNDYNISGLADLLNHAQGLSSSTLAPRVPSSAASLPEDVLDALAAAGLEPDSVLGISTDEEED